MSGAALRLVAAVSAAYMLSHFFRAANAVIGTDLMRDLALSPADLGLLTGIFFVIFAGCQIPVGILLDRFGPKRVMLSLMVIAVLGAIVFAIGRDLASLGFGRALLGIGTSALLVGPLVLFSRWFAADRFGTVAGIFVALGTAGSLLATTPLALLAEAAGWRGAFFAMAGATALMLVVLAVVVRDGPDGRPAPARGETLAEAFRGVLTVARDHRTPGIFGMNLTVYAAGITILGLWGGPYLAHVHGLSKVEAGNILLAIGIASVAGYLAFGPLDRWFGSRKRPALAGTFATVALLGLLAALPGLPLWVAAVLLVGIGFTSGGFVLVVAHGRAIAPDHLVGRAVTLFNIGTMGGAALMQWLTGLVIGAVAGTDSNVLPETAFRAMFALLAASLVLAAIGYIRVPEARAPVQEQQHAS
jgi:predicted MFS family arabinose efflux permease